MVCIADLTFLLTLVCCYTGVHHTYDCANYACSVEVLLNAHAISLRAYTL